MHPLVEQLRGTLLPAVVTPMDSDGVVAYDALTAYAGALTAESIGGRRGVGPYRAWALPVSG